MFPSLHSRAPLPLRQRARSQLQSIDAGATGDDECETGRNFDGRGCTKSGTNWRLATHQDVCAAQPLARPFQFYGDTKRIVAPVATSARWWFIQINFCDIRK